MKLRILLLAALWTTSCLAAKEPAIWSHDGRTGTLIFRSEGGPSASAVIALPPDGGCRVSALELDGHAVNPEGLAWCAPPGILRRVRVCGVAVLVEDRPWREARLTLQFDDFYTQDRIAPSDFMLDVLLLNPGQASLQSLPSESSDRDGDEIFDGQSHWIRLDYNEAGFYRLQYDDLVEQGVPLGVDPASFRLLGRPGETQPFRMGWGGSWERGWSLREIPIQVLGGSSFGPDSEIRCHLPGLDGWATELDAAADPDLWRRHPYAVWSTVYLTWGGESGLRPAEIDGTPTGTAPLVESLDARVHRERNIIYDNHDLHEDGWAWVSFVRSSTPDLFFNEAGLLWPRADRPVKLRLGYDKPSIANPVFDHQLRAYLGTVDGLPDQDQMLIDEQFRLTGSVNMVVLEGEALLPHLSDGQDAIDFWLELPKENGDDYGYFLWYEIFYETRLRTRYDLPMELHLPGGEGVVELSVSDWGAEPEVWDTSDPYAPVIITGGQFESGVLGVELDASLPRNISLLRPDGNLGLREFTRIRQTAPQPLRHDSLPDMIVVYHDAFASVAQVYGNWRSANFPGQAQGELELVAISDIYANFSGGMQDVAALRNFLKYRYETAGSKLCYVLFLGDADSDYRNFSARDVTGEGTNALIPALSDRFRSEQLAYVYTTDDYFASMDARDDSLEIGLIDLAIGRMPVADLSSASDMVQRAMLYDGSPPEGRWKDRAVLAADDFFIKCADPDGIRHTDQAELLVREAIPWDLDLQKIYLCEYDCDSNGTKIDAQTDLMDALDKGVLFFNYVGHGGNDLLADERLLVEQNLYGLENDDRRFLFISASCNVGEFDNPAGKSMSELMISVPEGGAIATMAASALTGALFNNRLNRNFLEQLFPDRELAGSVPISLALMRAKVFTQVYDYNGGGYGSSTERYAILGDPALALATPEMSVDFETDSVDSLVVGGETIVRGRIMREGIFAPDFDGELHLSVRASADTSGYYYFHYGSERHQDYHLRGREVFRGRLPVISGKFVSPAFFFPRGSDTGPYGSILAFASGEGEAVGRVDSVLVLEGELPDDEIPPQVTLKLAGGAVNATPGTPLAIRASDASGINLIGGSPRTAMFLEYMESGQVDDLTDRFEYDTGSATEGEALSSVQSGLSPGEYTLVASVADNLGNVGRDTLRVRILEEGRYDLLALLPYPNPFSRRCAVTFEVTETAWVELGIYTLSGRKIRSMELECPEAGRFAFDWDGRDEEGDEIANGTYLYRIRAEFDEDGLRRRELQGALVKMASNP